MKFLSESWVGVLVGIVIVAGVFIWNRISVTNKHQAQPLSLDTGDSDIGVRRTPIEERIRQIALIERDEFETFYNPVIQKVEDYERVLGEELDRHYFETIYKALRKRRASIFEFGSSEKDQETKALWTYAIFCALSIRHIISSYQAFEFSRSGIAVSPFLLTLNDIAACGKRGGGGRNRFCPNSLNIHLIDKVLSPQTIERFSKAGIYPFILNSVSGFYQERINPFYSIIEQVESHMNGERLNAASVFQQTMKVLLTLIEQNTFSKNSKDAFVFEGTSYLLIDRNFLWELHRGYAISENCPLGKKAFEAMLSQVFELGKQLDRTAIYTVKTNENIMDDSQKSVVIELRNMVALSYKAVPYYQPSDRKRIQRSTLQRNVAISDTDRGTAEEHSAAQLEAQAESREKSQLSNNTSEKMGLKDLFSDQR